MEILNPYVNGLKFLFYSDKNGDTSISIFKIFFLIVYIGSIFAGFFQFLNLTSNDLQCEFIPGDIQQCSIRANIFGTIFNISSFVLLIGAFSLIFYSSTKNKEKTSYTYLSILTSFLLLMMLFGFLIDLLDNLQDFNESFSSLGYAFIVIWVLMFEPILFFGSVPLILEIISQDYELKGYSLKTKLFLVLEVILILLAIFLSLYWIINLHHDPNILKSFFDITVNTIGVGIVLGGLVLLLLFIIILILFFYFLDKNPKEHDSHDHLKAILPWIVFFSLIFFIIRGIPAIFDLDYRLKTLSDIIDVLVIFFIIFLAIIQVSSVQEHIKPLSKHLLYNPLKWTDHMPKYSKILLLLYLNTEIFYQQLYQNALSSLTGEDNEIIILKAVSLVTFYVIGFVLVYFRFKPSKPHSEGYGPIKSIKNEFIKKITGIRQK